MTIISFRLIAARKRSCGKVMFSVVSVYVPRDHYLTAQGALVPTNSWILELPLLTYCGQDWRPVQTCLFEDPAPPPPPRWRYMVLVKTRDLFKLVHFRTTQCLRLVLVVIEVIAMVSAGGRFIS